MTEPAPRTDPQLVAGEGTMLQEWLDYHRATLRMKCAGLSDDQLRLFSCLPSNLSLLGLVRHLTDVERGWFLRGLGGRTPAEVPPLYYSDDDPEGDIENVGAVDVTTVFDTYDQAIAEIRAATADVDLDHTFRNGQREYSARWVYLHMIEEYARHNGHADLIRERIDGVTGD